MEAASTTPKNVFVTGATSAAGRAVIQRLLAAGHRVTGAVASVEQAEQLRAIGALPAYPDLLREGEIRSALTAAQANILVHCEPLKPNEVPFVRTNWEAYERLLGQGTAALIRAAEAAGIEYVVVGSYAFVYGDTHGHVADETTAPAHIEEPFIRSALQAEKAALQANVPACVLRAGYVYSAHSDSMVGLRDTLKTIRPAIVGGDHDFANWVHADDFAQAVLLCIEQRPAGEIFNIVDDQPVSTPQFAGYLAESLQLTPPRKAPGFLSGMLAGKTQTGLLKTSVKASNQKAAEKLGWKPQYRTYREGIDQTLMILRAEEPVR